ncbi:MAG: beta-galactosidase [Candidatus Obscuribacterales bacterium]|nr:beta-galactosidase [Candidatus Obscuribacterales bacterium]
MNTEGQPTHTVMLDKRRIMIDGKPRLVLSGEIHYFRLPPGEWEDRLLKLKRNGLDTVATYIPWIWHELPDGSVDLTGITHPQRDLVAFLDLCAKHGLNVIARPGPFIMAELKNEGIPYRLYKAPFVQPTTWNGAPVTTRTLDYLCPHFLAAAKSWYGQVIPVLAPRLKSRGGSVIAVQLDNEIGMLSWVSNCPDLTDVVCEDLRQWAVTAYGGMRASSVIGADSSDPIAFAARLRAPGDSLPLHDALGRYMRDRFRRYVKTLRQYAEEFGISDVLWLVNVHGTGGDRGRTFPIGISQLFESYRDQPNMTAGTDHYLGNLTVTNVGDLVAMNEFMLATLDADQPLTSLEHEAGNGNYGDDLGVLNDPEATELKARICIMLCKALNFYLQAGGENPPMPSEGDGTDRLAFTGQRHGFAAPVNPEGELDVSYFALSNVVKSFRAVERQLADCVKENDDMILGFVPDHYLSEYRYPGAIQRAAQIADLEQYRGFGPGDIIARAMVLGGYSFGSQNLQSGVPTASVVVVASGLTLGREVQENLAEYLRGGGKLMLVGLLPERDHDGTPCTILADVLGLKSAGTVHNAIGPNGQYWPSVAANGSLAPQPEVRVNTAQLLVSSDGSDIKSPLFTEIASGKTCAAQMRVGAGEAIILGCDYPMHFEVYAKLFSLLGVQRRWIVDAGVPGVFAVSTLTPDGERLLHVINVAPYAVAYRLRDSKGRDVFKRKLRIPARSGVMLPFGVKTKHATIVKSTAEIVQEGRKSLLFRPTQKIDTIVLKTDKKILCHGHTIMRDGKRVTLRLYDFAHQGKSVKVIFE